MHFKYTAADLSGKIIESDVESEDVAGVLKILAGQGLKPISITALRPAKARPLNFFGAKITVKDQVLLTRYLALMLRVGMDIFSAIEILIKNFENPAVKSFLREVRLNIEKGQPFYAAFTHYPNYFSPVFVNLIKAGEASGTLEKVFDGLSVNLEREENLRNNIKSALVYPTILFVMASLVLLFLVTFALPRIAKVFEGGGFSPPAFSRIVFGIGLFLGKHVWLVFGGFFAFLIGAFAFFKTPTGKRFAYTIFSHTPIIKSVVERVAVQRFAATLSSLLQAGLPVLDSLEVTADVVNLESYKSAIRRVAREGLSKGRTIGEAFQREAAFPIVVSNLIAISEKTGRLPEILNTLSHFYEEEVNNSIKRLVVFLEPVMLLGIGLIVGLIALSIIVPIYQLVGQFS